MLHHLTHSGINYTIFLWSAWWRKSKINFLEMFCAIIFGSLFFTCIVTDNYYDIFLHILQFFLGKGWLFSKIFFWLCKERPFLFCVFVLFDNPILGTSVTWIFCDLMPMYIFFSGLKYRSYTTLRRDIWLIFAISKSSQTFSAPFTLYCRWCMVACILSSTLYTSFVWSLFVWIFCVVSCLVVACSCFLTIEPSVCADSLPYGFHFLGNKRAA